jgi:hypothetical protein
MRWLSVEGIVITGILLLSAVADILFIIVVYKAMLKLFKNPRTSIKTLAFVLAVVLCVPFVIALHRFTIFFLVRHIAYLWLIFMIVLCAGLVLSLGKLTKKL